MLGINILSRIEHGNPNSKSGTAFSIFKRTTQNETSGQLKISYLDAWQRDSYAVSTELKLNNQHILTVAYNYLDNLLPREGERMRAKGEGITRNGLGRT